MKGWLYRDDLRIVAELDGAGAIVSRFVWADGTGAEEAPVRAVLTRLGLGSNLGSGAGPNVPAYVVHGGEAYRILADHLGTPRLVVNAATGVVAARFDVDEWGNVLADTNPGFVPFGFAGGLYDADTGLVRFGARDYDVVTGRWLSKDPIRFAGGQTNLYAYIGNDPLNGVDPSGLGLRACAKALAELAAAEGTLARRLFENETSECGPDPGHDKAIEQARNRVDAAQAKVLRHCTERDLAKLALGSVVLGVVAGAAGAIGGAAVIGGAVLAGG